VPDLEVAPALAVAFILNEPLFEPLDGVEDSQLTLLLTLHALLDVTLIRILLAAAEGTQVLCETERVAGGAACVTLIVLVNPPPVTVMVPVLDEEPVLAVVFILKLPFPVPLAVDTVSQLVLLLLTLHALVDVTLIVVLLAADAGDHVLGDTVNAAGGASCVTFIVRVIPPPVIVIAPVLEVTVVLAVTFILKWPLLVPLDGVTVSQLVLLLVTPHGLLDVMLIVVLPAADAGVHVVCDAVSIAGAGGCATAIVLLGTPETVTVIVPTLVALVVLACAFIRNEPLSVRFVGVT